MEKKTTQIKVPLTLDATADENPLITTMSFVFVDNRPNSNFQGIKSEQFPVLIASGSLMPIKMEVGRIGSHKDAKPLGVITSLDTDIDRVVGHAALWNEERPSDIALLRELLSKKEPVDISFEVKYSEFEMDEAGVEWLLDPIVRGATIVSNPAYAGRTPVLAMASDEKLKELPDSCFAYIAPGGTSENDFTNPRDLRCFPYKSPSGDIDETLLKESIAALEQVKDTFEYHDGVLKILGDAQLELNKERLRTMENEKITELENANATLKTQVEELVKERDDLKAWKEAKEKEEAEAALLKSRLAKLGEAGFEYTPEQIDTKRAFWLALDDAAFGMFVEELKVSRIADADKHRVPRTSSATTKADKDELLDFLKDTKEH